MLALCSWDISNIGKLKPVILVFQHCRIQQFTPESGAILDISQQPVNVTLNALLTLEAVLNPTSSIEPFLQQILVVEAAQVCPNIKMSVG